MASCTRRRAPISDAEREARAARNAERNAETRALRDRIVAALPHPDVWSGVMSLAARIEDRGPVNVLLIAGQRPNATEVRGVQGEHGWNKRGRHVRKGEKGLRIFAPCRSRATTTIDTATDTDAAATPGREGNKVHIRRFTTRYVFDVGQTDGADYTPPARPTVPVAHVISSLSSAITSLFALDVRWADVERFHFDPHADELVIPVGRSGFDDALALLTARARLELSDQHEHEAVSAAHLAARMLGLPAGPCPVPPIEPGEMSTDPVPPIQRAAVRVITTGREIAATVRASLDASRTAPAPDVPENCLSR